MIIKHSKSFVFWNQHLVITNYNSHLRCMEDEMQNLSLFKATPRFLFTQLQYEKKMNPLLFLIFVELVPFLLQARFFSYSLLSAESCEAVEGSSNPVHQPKCNFSCNFKLLFVKAFFMKTRFMFNDHIPFFIGKDGRITAIPWRYCSVKR